MFFFSRALRTIDATTISGTPATIGAVIPFNVLKVTLINTSDVDIDIDDGSNRDAIRVPANGTVNIGEGLSAYGALEDTGVVFKNGTQLTATQVTGAGSSGNLIVNALGK